MQRYSQKNHAAQPAGNEKSGSNRHAVKKCVNREPEQRGDPCVTRHKFFDMRFFTEMEVRREVMLEKMNDEISHENEKISTVPTQRHRFGQNLENGSSQHETSAQCEERFQILT